MLRVHYLERSNSAVRAALHVERSEVSSGNEQDADKAVIHQGKGSDSFDAARLG